MDSTDKIDVVGKLGTPYGIKGWLKIHSFTEQRENIFSYQPWFLQSAQGWQQIDIEDWKYHNKDLIVKLKNVNDRNQAQLLTNIEVGIDVANLPALSDEYYWRDLIGCRVITTTGYDLGIVEDMLETGSNDVLIIKSNINDAYAKQERLVPFLVEQVVKRVDLTTKQVEVDWDPEF